MRTISSEELLAKLSKPESQTPAEALIDVRSESEYDQGHIIGFVNAPILSQSERHAVGISYKHSGFGAALKLASELVTPQQSQRRDRWLEVIRAAPAQTGVIMCWRGGMRSRYACDWLNEAAPELRIEQLTGGYKALRRALLQHFDACPPLIVVTGLTGSGKTALLHALAASYLDLESAANHRGSAFGAFMNQPQPSQATFENTLGLQIARQKAAGNKLFVEDESRVIGRCSIPNKLMEQMRHAPVMLLESSLEERTQRIFDEYIATPFSQGIPLVDLEIQALAGIKALKRRLDAAASPLLEQAQKAFQRGVDANEHQSWIASLLSSYYDKRYFFATTKHKRKLVFRGNFQSCLQWAQDQILYPQQKTLS